MTQTTIVRSRWAQDTIDAAQILIGAIEHRHIPAIRTALDNFERMASDARAPAERVLLRGLLVDLYQVAEQRLEDSLPPSARGAARDAFAAARGDADGKRFADVIRRLLPAPAFAVDGPSSALTAAE